MRSTPGLMAGLVGEIFRRILFLASQARKEMWSSLLKRKVIEMVGDSSGHASRSRQRSVCCTIIPRSHAFHRV